MKLTLLIVYFLGFIAMVKIFVALELNAEGKPWQELTELKRRDIGFSAFGVGIFWPLIVAACFVWAPIYFLLICPVKKFVTMTPKSVKQQQIKAEEDQRAAQLTQQAKEYGLKVDIDGN